MTAKAIPLGQCTCDEETTELRKQNILLDIFS